MPDGAPQIRNLYRLTRSQDEIRRLFPDMTDRAGNLAPLEGISPDQAASIIRSADRASELAVARWGMPSPAVASKGKKTDRGVTNMRNTESPHWRRWLGPEHRCLVPLTAFSEPEARAGRGRGPVWFALLDEQPLTFFAGLRTRWTSVRKPKEVEVTVDLFGSPADLMAENDAPCRAIGPGANGECGSGNSRGPRWRATS